MHKVSVFILFFFFISCGDPSVQSEPQQIENLYLGVEKESYLTGKFNSLNVLSEVKPDDSSKDHYLRPEVKKAFLKMITAFEENKPSSYKQHIFLVSSFRNFSHQKGIWESKYTGKKVMREPIEGKSPEKIISLILEFSSAPGTSRHHWGTDFDINALENSYFENSGKGKVLYDWLKKNAAKYGFCQPYNELAERGGKGYHEEKWHWSYAPISNRLQKEWIKSFREKKIRLEGSFLGAEILGERALDYVQSINGDCGNISVSN